MKIKLIIYTPFFLVIFSCQQSSKTESANQTTVRQQKNKTKAEKIEDYFTYKTTFSPDIGWGYQILNNGAIYINQPHMPAVEGIQGFSDESKAIKTAELMIYKLKNGVFPPTISIEELDSLGVLKGE
jgi:hypothetical protein